MTGLFHMANVFTPIHVKPTSPFHLLGATVSRFCGILLTSTFLASCFTPKKSVHQIPPPAPVNPIEAVDTLVIVEAMDTVEWVDADTSSAPVLVNDEVAVGAESRHEADVSMERFYKDQYQITVLLPFFTQDSTAYLTNRPAAWALDFYLGFKLGLQKAPPGKGRFVVQTIDTKANLDVLERIIANGRLDQQDVIVGPYRSNLVSRVAEFVKDRPTLMISPYSASSRLGKDNPHYLQLNPALESHMRTTWQYLKPKQSSINPVIFIHGKSEGELSKKQLWQSWIDSLPPKTRERYSFKEIDEAGDMALENLLIDSLLEEGVLNNLVFPSWDETHVQAVMSKISSGIATKNVRLFGLPQWIEFDRISPSYFESLQVHLTSSDYVDDQDPEIRALKTKFKNAYAQTLNGEAIWGYRCGLFVAQALTEEGALFHRYLKPEHPMMFTKHSPRFVIQRHPDGGILQIENQNIVMLRYSEGKMVPAP